MGYTHLIDIQPKSRKEYRCYLCGESIPIGERHVKRTSVDDDVIHSTRMHTECEAESSTWKFDDWEYFFQGDMARPSRQTTNGD